MLSWETVVVRPHSGRVQEHYNAKLNIGEWTSLAEGLGGLWSDVARRLVEVINLDWDVLMVELWTDDGRIICYPLNRETNDRIRLDFQVTVPFIDDEFGRLPNSDKEPDAFEKQHIQMEERIRAALIEAASTPASRRSLNALRDRHPYRILCRIFTDSSTEVDITDACLGTNS